MEIVTGGCLCGAVRYEVQGKPLFAVHCHCRDCQRASGTGHVPVMGMARASFKVTGKPNSYTVQGTSGLKTTRHFCPTCGSLLFGMADMAPESVSVYVGTLDDPSVFQPETILFTRNRPAWDKLAGGLPEFETMPPAPAANTK
jgi:hypothetical protein